MGVRHRDRRLDGGLRRANLQRLLQQPQLGDGFADGVPPLPTALQAQRVRPLAETRCIHSWSFVSAKHPLPSKLTWRCCKLSAFHVLVFNENGVLFQEHI